LTRVHTNPRAAKNVNKIVVERHGVWTELQYSSQSQTWLKPWPITEALLAAPSTAELLANIFQYSAAAASSVVTYTRTLSRCLFLGTFYWLFFGETIREMLQLRLRISTESKGPFRAGFFGES